jgi:hypothetical protein
MVETMKNWNDTMTARAPGFRDRIVHLSHTPEEGGLNLDMPADMITRLSERGAAAGHKLIEKFTKDVNWDKHLWVRYRTALGMFQPLLQCAYDAYWSSAGGAGTFERLVDHRDDPDDPPDKKFGYALSNVELAMAKRINETCTRFPQLSLPSFEHNAPRPTSVLRARPRDA